MTEIGMALSNPLNGERKPVRILLTKKRKGVDL